MSQFHSHAQKLKMNWPATGSNLAYEKGPFVFLELHCPILSAKFDCPVAHQNILMSAAAHDCATALLERSITPSRGWFL